MRKTEQPREPRFYTNESILHVNDIGGHSIELVHNSSCNAKSESNGCTEIIIKINRTDGMTLKEALKEVWELREEHPDVKIIVEVIR